MATYSLSVYEMMIFRNSIRSGDGISLSMTKIPPDDILEGIYKLRLREYEKLKTVLAFYVVREHSTKRDGSLNHRPCTTHLNTPTSTARAGALMFHHPAWVEHHTSAVPVNTHGTPRPDFGQEAVGGSTMTTRARKRHATRDAQCEQQRCWTPRRVATSELGSGTQALFIRTWPRTCTRKPTRNMGVCESPQHGSGAMLQITTQHGSGARVQRTEAPVHGSGAELRTTAVTVPEHPRAPITEDWIKNITYFIAAKNMSVPESLVVGSTDMHEEKNIDTVIQSIYRDDRGKLNCSGRCCSSLHIFQLFQDALVWCWSRLKSDWQSRPEMIVPKSLLLRSLMTNLSRVTVKRSTEKCELVVLPLSSSSFLEWQLSKKQSWSDVVDEDDTLDDFDELDAGAAASIMIVCDGLWKGTFLFGTEWCKSCCILYTLVYQSRVGRLFCHVCPLGKKKRRMQVHRRKSASADRG